MSYLGWLAVNRMNPVARYAQNNNGRLLSLTGTRWAETDFGRTSRCDVRPKNQSPGLHPSHTEPAASAISSCLSSPSNALMFSTMCTLYCMTFTGEC